MEKRTWWKEGVVYQVYPRSFADSNGDGIGDIPGITEKLDYIKSLGATIIWLNPCYKSPGDDNGYDISDYQSILPQFGTMEDFKTLLAKAHAMGLRIIMDLVVNHTSDEHPWFVESRTGKDKKDWYIWREKSNNWGASFGGSAWEYDDERKMYYLHCFSKKQPDLNWENKNVRDAVYAMMNWWGELGIDGFRMDVITMISKDQRFPDGQIDGSGYGAFSPFVQNGPRVHEFIHEMHEHVMKNFDMMCVGEGAGCDSEKALLYTAPKREELDMVFTFDHVDIGKPSMANGFQPGPFSLPAFKEAFARWQDGLEGKGWNALYLENHDQVRSVSRYGNDRDYWKQSAKMLATLLFLLKGTPYIFEGEELGMTNYPFTSIEQTRDIASKNGYAWALAHQIPKEMAIGVIRQIARDNSRTPMQWTGGKNAGFSTGEPWMAVNPNASYINVEAEERDQDSILHYYRDLLKLRKESETLLYGLFTLLEKDDPKLFVYTRTLHDEGYLIVANFSQEESAYTIPACYRDGKTMLANYRDESALLRPYEVRVIYKKGITK